MPLSEVQEILARLSTETEFRHRFFADREREMQGMSLSSEDCETLRRLSQKQIERFADSLHKKRRTEVRPLLPWAVEVLGEQFDSLFAAHCDRYHPTGLLKPGDDAIAFCTFLTQSKSLNPLIRELLRWEAARWTLNINPPRYPRLLLFRCCPLTLRNPDKTVRYAVAPGYVFLFATRRGWRSQGMRTGSV